MKTLFPCMIIGLAASFVGCRSNEGSAANSNASFGLTVEYRTNPCGLDTPSPRLGWKLAQNAAAHNVTQTAYRVLVASSRENLDKNVGDLWDSGKVAGDCNVGIEYKGKQLPTSCHAFWKVMTWNNGCQEGVWSEVAEWTMGVMNAGDWKAKWIGPAALTRPDEDFGAAQWITAPADAKGVATLDFSFDFDGVNDGEYVEMVHAGVSQHEIYVNDKQFNKWSGRVHDWRYLRFRDLTPYLVKGKNKVSVRIFADVPRTGRDPIDPIRFHAPKDARAFLAKIVFPNGKTLVTGKDGWSSPNGAVAALGGVRAPEWGRHMVLRAENASPAFEKKFEIRKPVASAVLHVTGVGFYEAHLNGAKIGEKVLDPAPTAFDKRVLYSTYRLDGKLRTGANELKILVGHGWYDMRAVATWNFETAPWRDFPRCIAQLEVTYKDGTKEIVATDKTWRQVKSPVGHDDVFEGEVVGAWNPRAIDLDKNVVMAEEVSAPGKRLESEAQPGAKIMRTFAAKSVHPCGDGVYVVDFGENIAGWARITFRNQQKGDVVSIRYDERVNADMTPAAPSAGDGLSNFKFSNTLAAADKGAEHRKVDAHFRYTASHRVCAKDAEFQCDRFVCTGAAAETYEPRFAWNGFRYVVLRGLRTAPKVGDLTACVIHTAFKTIGSFECSHATFNKLMDMGDKAYRGNFADGVPTDCPHREKNGWTGDASIASELAQYLYENTAGYEKWLRDILDSQLENGNIPGIVPSSGWGYHWGNGPAWDSALPVVAWNLWTFRGNRRILDEVYPALVKYLAYTATKADADGLVRHGLGDWVPVDRKHMPSTELTSSCYYYQAITITANIAGMKGLKDEEAKYRAMAAKTRAGINKKFYKGDGVYDNGYQSAQAFPLAYGIVEESERAKTEAKLVAAVEAADGHVDVGLLGSKHVFRVLSRAGRTDLAFKMIVNPTKPSPAEWVQKGGTTLWEDWRDGSSRNHIMFGDFVGWAYQYLAGIRPVETEGSTSAVTVATKPAFGEIVLAPQSIKALDWAKAKVAGPNGEIVSSWKRTEKGVEYVFVVPPNTKARIMLPGEAPKCVGSGCHKFVGNL